MKFYMPTKVYDDWFSVWEQAEALAAFGTKALLVTGRHSAKACGAEDDVLDALTRFDTAYAIFDQVEANPSTETIMRARDFGLSEGCDFVIGIGGGSPLDAAKAIALMMAHPNEGIDYLYDKGAAAAFNQALPTVVACLPVVAVPTTCGTGSEVTGVSVLTRHDRKTKGSIPFKIYPDMALVDPKYLAFASNKLICNTAVDALCHLFESYLNTGATDYSRMCVDAGLKVWARSREAVACLGKLSCRYDEPIADVLFEDESDADFESELTVVNLSDMMRASTLAGMAIAHTGTSLPHALSYEVTYNLGIAHGRACGKFLTGYLREADPDAAAYLLRTAGFWPTTAGTAMSQATETSASRDSGTATTQTTENSASRGAGTAAAQAFDLETALQNLEDFFVQTCGDFLVPDDIMETNLMHLLDNPAKLALAPFDVDESVLRRIAGM